MRLNESLTMLLLLAAPASSDLGVGVAHAQDRATWVTPYPGPVPTSWASVVDYERYAELRAWQLGARQEGLAVAGRPEGYHFKRTALLTTLVIGAVMATIASAIVLTASDQSGMSHSDDWAIGTALLGGAALALAGGAGTLVLRRKNAYREEIQHLLLEQRYWMREARRVKRELAESGFTLSLTGTGLHGTF
jgi:hypothetical protein